MSAISTHSTHEMWIKPVRWLGGIIISHLKSFVYGQGVLLVSSWAMVAWWRFIMMLMMPWEGRHTHNNLQRLQQKKVLSRIKCIKRWSSSIFMSIRFLFGSELKHLKSGKVQLFHNLSLRHENWGGKIATQFSENEGRSQRPFGTFPKIHPFWRCHLSLLIP